MKTRSASSWVCRVIEGMGDRGAERRSKSVQRFLPLLFSLPPNTPMYIRVSIYIYIQRSFRTDEDFWCKVEGGHGRGLISNDPGFAGVNKKRRRRRDRSTGK